jgi:NAD-dependent deacetylase
MESINQAVQLIQESSSVVALTGAGISTDSGIPDFRSPDGLWSKYPVKLGDYRYFQKHPDQFIKMGKELLPLLLNAQPNKGHKALKELEDMGKLTAVITQNIDGLHQMAGSQTVIEIHGTYKTATCLQCNKPFTLNQFLSLFSTSFLCPDCSGMVKPDIVMFGEELPREEFSKAVKAAHMADVMLVVGSRLEVYPASHLVLVTKEGGSLIIINDTTTALDKMADVIVRGDISVCLPKIINRLKEEENT